MGWMIVAARRLGRLRPVGDDDVEVLLNGFACEAEIRALAICCPGCGATYEIKAGDGRSRIFNRRAQRFRCSQCRLSARVRVAIDIGFAADERDTAPVPASDVTPGTAARSSVRTIRSAVAGARPPRTD